MYFFFHILNHYRNSLSSSQFYSKVILNKGEVLGEYLRKSCIVVIYIIKGRNNIFQFMQNLILIQIHPMRLTLQ